MASSKKVTILETVAPWVVLLIFLWISKNIEIVGIIVGIATIIIIFVMATRNKQKRNLDKESLAKNIDIQFPTKKSQNLDIQFPTLKSQNLDTANLKIDREFDLSGHKVIEFEETIIEIDGKWYFDWEYFFENARYDFDIIYTWKRGTWKDRTGVITTNVYASLESESYRFSIDEIEIEGTAYIITLSNDKDNIYVDVSSEVFEQIKSSEENRQYSSECLWSVREYFEYEPCLVFYYKQEWYITKADISIDEAIILIKSSDIRYGQKLPDDIEQGHIEITNRLKQKSRQSIPKDVQKFVWNRDGGKCIECGSNERLEYDHIIPVSRGGSNTARNIQLLCEQCNRSKGNRIG